MLQTTDPVTREIIKNALMSAADTMALTVVRTARSAVIKHGMDFSTALFNAEGQQVAQGLTLPPHLGSMAPALEGVMNAFGDDVKPGDIFANNDPYEGASHLPDIFLFKPIFVNDVLMGWSCCIGHQTDIGGRVAGGNACDNTEIYQEGLILPPLKLYAEGELNQAVWRILEKNVRVPEKVLGDVQALLAAVRFGERDLLRLVDDYGLEEMKSYMADILDTTEALTRAEFSSLPQGEWDFVDHIDNDGIDPQSIDIHVNVKIDGDEVFVDFDGTSPQAKGRHQPQLRLHQVQRLRRHEVPHRPGHPVQQRLLPALQHHRPRGLLRQSAAPGAGGGTGSGRLPHLPCHVRRHGPGHARTRPCGLGWRRDRPLLRRISPQPQGLGLPRVQQRWPSRRWTQHRRRPMAWPRPC